MSNLLDTQSSSLGPTGRLEGAEVVGAATGRDALAACRRHRFDVVVVDLGLPDIPGDVLMRAIIAGARRPP